MIISFFSNKFNTRKKKKKSKFFQKHFKNFLQISFNQIHSMHEQQQFHVERKRFSFFFPTNFQHAFKKWKFPESNKQESYLPFDAIPKLIVSFGPIFSCGNKLNPPCNSSHFVLWNVKFVRFSIEIKAPLFESDISFFQSISKRSQKRLTEFWN